MSPNRDKLISAVLIIGLTSFPIQASADFDFKKLTPAQSAAYNAGFDVCLKAKEQLPQIPAIRRTPNTIGDIGNVTDVKFQKKELLISWEIKNVYTDKSLKVVLSGICTLTDDGRTLKRILVKE